MTTTSASNHRPRSGRISGPDARHVLHGSSALGGFLQSSFRSEHFRLWSSSFTTHFGLSTNVKICISASNAQFASLTGSHVRSGAVQPRPCTRVQAPRNGRSGVKVVALRGCHQGPLHLGPLRCPRRCRQSVAPLRCAWHPSAAIRLVDRLSESHRYFSPFTAP